jgi:hypothetical protein
MPKFSDLTGILGTYLRLGVTNVIRLKNATGEFVVRNGGDTADVPITGSILKASADTGLIINSDAAGSGADWSITLARPASGQAASYTLTLPTSTGSVNQVLATNGSGVLSWASAGSTADKQSTDSTTLVFGTTSPLSLFTLPVNAVVEAVRIIVDTAFNGSPSVSVGVSGTTSKYFASTQIDLTTVGIYEVYPGLVASGSTESLIATYSAGGASVGSARIEIDYVVPS